MLALLLLCALPVVSLAQSVTLASVPSDPLELATGSSDTVTTAQQRAAVIALLNRAQANYSMHARVSSPHILEISFNASASTLFPAGAGTLRETWISGLNWRWDATLGSYALTRISSSGIAYDQQQPRPLPLRLKMLAAAVFNPVPNAAPRQQSIRTFTANWKGASVTCILSSFSGIASEEQLAPGRDWRESEYCIDPASGLLQIASAVPGLYAAYDYTNALHFHGQTLPSGILVTEAGNTVLQAQLTSVTDTDPSDQSPFTPTAQMVSQGPAVAINAPFRMRMDQPSANVAPGATVEPVIVHITLDQQGHVQESELLQTSSFSAQALAFVSGVGLGKVPGQPGAPQRQREVYIEVRFRPFQSARARRLPSP